MFEFKPYTIEANTYIDMIFIEAMNNKLFYTYSNSTYRHPTDTEDILLKLYKNIYLLPDPTENALFDFCIFLMH